MSETDETAAESQTADTQEETVAEANTQQEADETVDDSSESETDETQNEDETDSESDATANNGEQNQQAQNAPSKTKEEYIQERIARREAKRSALVEANMQFRQNMDTNDLEQRMQAVENDRFVERVENNISNARRDIEDVQKLPVFEQDPELFVEIMRDTVDRYGVFHTELQEADGSPAFLGFYDPKTGDQISIKSLVQREADRLNRIAEKTRAATQAKASDDDAKVRARAEVPNSGGKNTIDNTGDENLTAAQYAKKYSLKSMRA